MNTITTLFSKWATMRFIMLLIVICMQFKVEASMQQKNFIEEKKFTPGIYVTTVKKTAITHQFSILIDDDQQEVILEGTELNIVKVVTNEEERRVRGQLSDKRWVSIMDLDNGHIWLNPKDQKLVDKTCAEATIKSQKRKRKEKEEEKIRKIQKSVEDLDEEAKAFTYRGMYWNKDSSYFECKYPKKITKRTFEREYTSLKLEYAVSSKSFEECVLQAQEMAKNTAIPENIAQQFTPEEVANSFGYEEIIQNNLTLRNWMKKNRHKIKTEVIIRKNSSKEEKLKFAEKNRIKAELNNDRYIKPSGKYLPGTYIVMHSIRARENSEPCSRKTRDILKGISIELIDVQYFEDKKCIRGQTEKGDWITIENVVYDGEVDVNVKLFKSTETAEIIIGKNDVLEVEKIRFDKTSPAKTLHADTKKDAGKIIHNLIKSMENHRNFWAMEGNTEWIQSLIKELEDNDNSEQGVTWIDTITKDIETMEAHYGSTGTWWEKRADLTQKILFKWFDGKTLDDVLKKAEEFHHDTFLGGYRLTGKGFEDLATEKKLTKDDVTTLKEICKAIGPEVHTFKVSSKNIYHAEHDRSKKVEDIVYEKNLGSLNTVIDVNEIKEKKELDFMKNHYEKCKEIFDNTLLKETVKIRKEIYFIWKFEGYATGHHQDIHIPPQCTIYNQLSGVSLFHFLPLLVGQYISYLARHEGAGSVAWALRELNDRGIGQKYMLKAGELMFITAHATHGVFVPDSAYNPKLSDDISTIRAIELIMKKSEDHFNKEEERCPKWDEIHNVTKKKKKKPEIKIDLDEIDKLFAEKYSLEKNIQ